jgi:predicted transcriptional regulator of viral defense system
MKNLTRYILTTLGGKAVRKASLESVCRRFEADSRYTVNYMSAYGYLVRVMNSVYYVKTLEEFSSGRAVDVHRVISLGLDELGVNWYFGLDTALRMNGATHEYSDTVFVVNDVIYRNREVRIAETRVKFIKISSRLLGFGVVAGGGVRYSDLEKTLLDMIYLSRYRSVPEGRIAAAVEEYRENVDVGRMREYLSAYPMKVGEVAKDAGLV